MFKLNPFKQPYKRIDFELWAKACYNFAILSSAGTPVLAVSKEYSKNEKFLYISMLFFVAYIFLLGGRKLSHLMEIFDKE